MRRTNWTTIALIGGLVLLLLVVGYFATRQNADQDKLSSNEVAKATPTDREKLCASSATYDLIKRELFRRAAQVRGSDQAAYDRLATYAVLRMDNPVMESQDAASRAVNCSGTLSLDLPPGVAVVGGRRMLASDIDYTVTSAADGSGTVVLLRNPDGIVTPLATLGRINSPQPAQAEQTGVANEAGPETSSVAPEATLPAPASPQIAVPPSRPQGARPSFDCANAHSRGEVAVCSEAGLAALDRQMAAQYGRAFAVASPEERALLRDTARRFYAFRDRCADNRCIGDAYVGRMREIRDIMEGRWQPPR
jgi:uncharacterized protein YecT (DUF1311 family)